MHILFRHYDYYLNETYNNIVSNIREDINEKTRSLILNYAFDYYINSYLIEQAVSGSKIASFANIDSDFIGLYDPNLSSKKMQQPEIVEKLTKDMKHNTEEIKSTSGEVIGEINEIDINGNISVSVNIDGGYKMFEGVGETESANQSPSEALDSVRERLIERTRGDETSGTLSKLGISYKLKTDWFKYLKSSAFAVVKHTQVTTSRRGVK
jgi:hypothetical protein